MENIKGTELDELKIQGEKLLIDYWAPWCMPCKSLIPRLEKIESEYPDVKFVKINVDENSDHAMNVGIRSVPTVMFFDGENIVDISIGVKADDYYKTLLKSL